MNAERRRLSKAPDFTRELGEHTSSLRAMRTERTLNLTAQLMNHLRHEDDITGPTPEGEHCNGGRHNRHDQWTRWPLPDAPQSDWDLEDEIGVLVRREFMNKRDSVAFDDAEEDYVEQLVEYLTPIVIQFLERILVLVEDHTFPRPPSLQDRINPMDWHDLANVLASPAATDVMDRQLLERYVDRMEGMLGSEDNDTARKPCPRRAIERRDMFDRQRAQRAELHDHLMSSLFQLSP